MKIEKYNYTEYIIAARNSNTGNILYKIKHHRIYFDRVIGNALHFSDLKSAKRSLNSIKDSIKLGRHTHLIDLCIIQIEKKYQSLK